MYISNYQSIWQIEAGVEEVAVFTAASEAFTKKNTNCTIKESLDRISKITNLAQSENIKLRGYVSCIVGCPYQGKIDPSQVIPVSINFKIIFKCDLSLNYYFSRFFFYKFY